MQQTSAITVLLIDYHALIRSGISVLLNTYPDFQVIGQAGDAEEALRLSDLQPPNVVVLDLEMPGAIGSLELIRLLRRRNPQTRFIVLTNLLELGWIREAFREDVAGYVLKTISTDELAQAIRAAYRGAAPTLSPEVMQLLIHQVAAPVAAVRSLTAREHEVLSLMARGWNNHQIAAELNISLSTVQFHVGNILAKLDVHNRTEAATFALRNHIAPAGVSAHGQA